MNEPFDGPFNGKRWCCPICGSRLQFVATGDDPAQLTGFGCVSCDWKKEYIKPGKKKIRESTPGEWSW